MLINHLKKSAFSIWALAFFPGFLAFSGMAQNIPVVNNPAWQLSAGNTFSIPVSVAYHDFSLVKYSDYYWEYEAVPVISYLAPYAEITKVKNASFNSNNTGFYSYSLAIRQSITGLKYQGWEGGGNSGVFYEGTGKKTWRDTYAEGSFRITHQFGMGRRSRPVLNTLGFSCGFFVFENDQNDFTGSFNNGSVYHSTSVSKGIPAKWYLPQLKLNYDFSIVIRKQKFIYMPLIRTSILNFNNFLRFGSVEHTPLQRRPEYFKEISLGITFMRNSIR